jgi:hypothetical protein
MDKVSRREFLRGSLAGGACVAIGLRGNSEWKYKWRGEDEVDAKIEDVKRMAEREALKEHRLREQISELMMETNVGVEYCYREENGRIVNSFFNSGKFVGGYIPVRHLKRVRSALSLGLFRMRSRYCFDYATMFVRDRNVRGDEDCYKIVESLKS